MRARLLLLSLLALQPACSGNTTTGPGGNNQPTHENVAGTYSGVLVGVAQGVALDAVFSLTISQSGGTLTGSWGISGTLNDGQIVVNVVGSGALTGSIGSGQNPTMSITVTNPCPNYQATFTGSYNSTTRQITLNGPVDILDNCVVFLTYPSVIVLAR